MNLTVELIFLIPIITGLLCFISPKDKLIPVFCISGAIIGTIYTFFVCVPVFLDHTIIEYGVWYIDGLSAFFLMVTSTVALVVSMYSKGYMEVEKNEGKIRFRNNKQYYLNLNLFIAIMLSLFTVSSLGLMWILIEVTTLASTFLVGFYSNEKSTEAAWKYMIICSVGITLALIGISIVYASTIGIVEDESSALNWSVLLGFASQLDPNLIKTAMALIIVGFGTKVGFAPLHTWLPDAHSQALTPVSALMSATLLNCALYCILRFYIISEITIPGFASNLLLIFGFLSLIVAASFILISRDIKRMLAYSSVENMGIIAIGFGIGTQTSIFASLFMIMAHSIVKPILFFSAGNIMQAYGTKDMPSIKGLKNSMPFTAVMFMIGSLAILGMPVFASFVGELMMIISAFETELWWIAIPFVALLLIIFAGFMSHVIPMFSGESKEDVKELPGFWRKVPFLLLVSIAIFFGLVMPESIFDGLNYISESIFGGLL